MTKQNKILSKKAKKTDNKVNSTKELLYIPSEVKLSKKQAINEVYAQFQEFEEILAQKRSKEVLELLQKEDEC